MQVTKVQAILSADPHGEAVRKTPGSENSAVQEAFSNYAWEASGGGKKDTSVRDTSLTPYCPGMKENSRVEETSSDLALISGQEIAVARTKRETSVLDMTVRYVGSKASNLSPKVRQQLDDIAARIQGMNVERIQIDGYALFFREFATPRAEAVKAYLAGKGVDQNLVYTKGYGSGLRSRSYPMGRDNAVEIKVYGTPKQETTAAEAAAPLARRSVELLIA